MDNAIVKTGILNGKYYSVRESKTESSMSIFEVSPFEEITTYSATLDKEYNAPKNGMVKHWGMGESIEESENNLINILTK